MIRMIICWTKCSNWNKEKLVVEGSVHLFFCLFVFWLIRILVVTVKLHLIPIVIVGFTGVGTVLVVKDLARQAIGSHTLLWGHFVGAHLQRDCRGITVLQLQLLIKNVPPGSWGCHPCLMDERSYKSVIMQINKYAK